MPCFHKLTAYQLDDGSVVFQERGSIRRELTLNCGQCIGCRLTRARNWAIRCVHEAQLHDVSSFVTLTYDEDNYSPSLRYRDFQLFMRRLRRSLGPTRFFAVGEYGDQFQRPHFHCLLFGRTFDKPQKAGSDIFTSSQLEKLWPHGISTFGSVTFQSAAYCARYSVKKVTGQRAAEHYTRVFEDTGELVQVVPEFARMSLKPGIGYPWFERYWRDVYSARDGVVVDGKTLPPPRYYDKLLDKTAPQLSCEKEYDRYVQSKQFEADCTPERLEVREFVAKARQKLRKRNVT